MKVASMPTTDRHDFTYRTNFMEGLILSIPRRFTIAEASHRVLDPITSNEIHQLGVALALQPGSRMLDLACGKGETLCLWAKHHGIQGVGVDLNPPFVAAARARANELGVDQQLEFVEADASDWVSDEPVDIAACIGATWIGDGLEGTIDLLARSLRPGGIALIGDCYWREIPPTQEAIRGCHANEVDDYPTLDRLIERVQIHGWDLVEMIHADERTWDRYVAAQWLNLRRFIDAKPDDELVPDLRSELDTDPVRYVRYQRKYLGWGIFAIIRR